MFLRGVNTAFRRLTRNEIIYNRVSVSHRHLSTLQKWQNTPHLLQKNNNIMSIGGFVNNARPKSTQSTNEEIFEKDVGNVTDQVKNTGLEVENTASSINATDPIWESTVVNDVAQNLPASIPGVPDVPAISPAVEMLNAAGEPTFASLGLNNYTPIGLVQACLEFLHVSMGIPWYAALAIGTIIIRSAVIPLVIVCQKNAAKTAEHMPEIVELQNKMADARKNGDYHEATMYGQQLMRYTEENNVSLFKGMMMPLVQAPIFISFFWGIRGMVHAPVESLKTGGLYWFTDLTVADPYYILPVVTCATVYLTIALATDSVAANTMSPVMKLGIKTIPVVMFPFIMSFEGAILCYWLTTNVFSFVQTSVLKSTKVRNYLNIPLPPKKTLLQEKIMKTKGFKEGFKDAVTNMQVARDLRDKERFDQIQFSRAGKGPLVKTFPIKKAKRKTI